MNDNVKAGSIYSTIINKCHDRIDIISNKVSSFSIESEKVSESKPALTEAPRTPLERELKVLLDRLDGLSDRIII